MLLENTDVKLINETIVVQIYSTWKKNIRTDMFWNPRTVHHMNTQIPCSSSIELRIKITWPSLSIQKIALENKLASLCDATLEDTNHRRVIMVNVIEPMHVKRGVCAGRREKNQCISLKIKADTMAFAVTRDIHYNNLHF